jgi:NDP-4-keto-2,6-dideoxyhexose 3-C-methyltransferase
MVTALHDVVADATSRVSLSPEDTVLDIGANDGTLLRMWPAEVTRLGFEPAHNLFYEAQTHHGGGKQNFIFPTFWPPRYDVKVKPKVITSIACFYDSDDPNAFVEAIKRWLHPEGVWINQLAYLPATLASNNFGDIVHEHLTYWTISSFVALLRRHGLALLDWSHNDVNGGSIRFIVGHGAVPSVDGWSDPVGLMALKNFGARIRLQRTEIRDFLHCAKRDGKMVVGYGASTKGSTYLQYWGVGPDLLPAIADRNPDKVGKFTPTGQLVISEEEMRNEQPDYLLALPFHFIDSFVEREAELLAHGTQFVVPLPELRMVGAPQAVERVA